jgi:hypothetical protein
MILNTRISHIVTERFSDQDKNYRRYAVSSHIVRFCASDVSGERNPEIEWEAGHIPTFAHPDHQFVSSIVNAERRFWKKLRGIDLNSAVKLENTL